MLFQWKLQLFIFIYNLFNDIARNSKNIVSNDWVIVIINRERCGRPQTWPSLCYDPGICLEGLQRTMKTSASVVHVLAEIQTGHFPNTSHKHYRLSELAWFDWVKTSQTAVNLPHSARYRCPHPHCCCNLNSMPHLHLPPRHSLTLCAVAEDVTDVSQQYQYPNWRQPCCLERLYDSPKNWSDGEA
jgi:hypothetical protein